MILSLAANVDAPGLLPPSRHRCRAAGMETRVFPFFSFLCDESSHQKRLMSLDFILF